MSVALDTNVIVEVVGGTPDVSKRTVELLREHGSRARLVISPVVYAELFAHPGWTTENLAEFLSATGVAVDWELRQSVWTRAGHAFARYANRRRRDEPKIFPRRLLADFVIGSHAMELGTLMTGDVGFFRKNFPDLRIVSA